MLEKALEVDPKSKEIATMLRDTTRKRNAEKGAAKRAEKGSTFKFDLSRQSETKTGTSEDKEDSQPVHIPAPQDTGREFVGCGTQSIVEQFLTNSLTSAITQFASQGQSLVGRAGGGALCWYAAAILTCEGVRRRTQVGGLCAARHSRGRAAGNRGGGRVRQPSG